MDWSHLEMPFVLSLFSFPFLYGFHFTSPPICSFRSALRCVFIISAFVIQVEGVGRKRGGEKAMEIRFYFLDTTKPTDRQRRLITSERQINKQDNF